MSTLLQIMQDLYSKDVVLLYCSVIDWPEQSHNLIPIRLMVEQLEWIIQKEMPRSQSNLCDVLLGEIYADYLKKLATRMPEV